MDLNEYETICIFKPYSPPDGIDKVVNKLKPYIEEGGGALIHTQPWGRRRLAYAIKKEREGLYVCLHYASLPVKVAEIEKILSYDESVLKYLTVKRGEKVADLARLRQSPATEIPSVFRPDAERGDYRGEYSRGEHVN